MKYNIRFKIGEPVWWIFKNCGCVEVRQDTIDHIKIDDMENIWYFLKDYCNVRIGEEELIPITYRCLAMKKILVLFDSGEEDAEMDEQE